MDLSLITGWISQNKEIASAILGAVLALFGGAVFEGFKGWRRRRVVRRALQVEVRRIRRELGWRYSRVDVFDWGGMSSADLAVHPWMHSVVIEGADSSPMIVESFLLVERLLRDVEAARSTADDRVRHRNGKHFDLVEVTAKITATEEGEFYKDMPSPSLIELRRIQSGVENDLAIAESMMHDAFKELHQRRERAFDCLDSTEGILIGRLAKWLRDAAAGYRQWRENRILQRMLERSTHQLPARDDPPKPTAR